MHLLLEGNVCRTRFAKDLKVFYDLGHLVHLLTKVVILFAPKNRCQTVHRWVLNFQFERLCFKNKIKLDLCITIKKSLKFFGISKTQINFRICKKT